MWTRVHPLSRTTRPTCTHLRLDPTSERTPALGRSPRMVHLPEPGETGQTLYPGHAPAWLPGCRADTPSGQHDEWTGAKPCGLRNNETPRLHQWYLKPGSVHLTPC